jgi:hypothetical protein
MQLSLLGLVWNQFSLAAERKALTCDNCQESRASDDTSFKGCGMVISDLAQPST